MSTPTFRVVQICTFVLSGIAAAHGGTVDAAILAAMKLPDAHNYHWISTVEDDARFYEIEGRTEKAGYTLVSMPLVSSLRRRLGADGTGVQTAIFKGDMSCVIQTPTGWSTPDELSPKSGSANSHGVSYTSLHTSRHSRSGGSASSSNYSNIQLNLSHPADEIGIIVGSYTDIHADESGVSGTLSEMGAKLLLVHPGQDEITPLNASGSFKLWIKDGILVKYEVRLAGTISVETGSLHREFTVHQTATTELRDVGTTRVDVPEEVRRKLG